jgi:hypothetical protein
VDFLMYWRPETAETELGAVLDHAGSQQFKRVQAGDTDWVVTSTEGQLQLLGRIEVEDIVDQQTAERRVGGRLWQSDFHALAKPGTEMTTVRIPVTDVAPNLRFVGKSDRLSISSGNIDPRQLQAMRRLTPRSARLLASKLGTLVNTLSILQVGEVYSREILKSMFGITDATIKRRL